MPPCLGRSALPAICRCFPSMAFAADRLQVGQFVVAAIGFGDTVINFSS